MKRRTVITSALLSVSVVGCLENTENEDTEKSSNNSTELHADDNITERNEERNMNCSFYIEIVDNPPKEAPIKSAKEHQLIEVSVIEEIFNRATDPDRDFEKSKRPSGEYEYFIVNPDTDEEMKEAMDALDALPKYRNDDYPSGSYIEKDGVVVAITEDCVTQ